MRLDSLNLGMLNLGDMPDAVGEEQRGLSGLCWVTQGVVGSRVSQYPIRTPLRP